MALLVNIRKLQDAPAELRGELSVEEIEFVSNDELISCSQPLKYDISVEHMGDSLLARGTASLIVDCECVRCLQPFQRLVELTDWACHLPLEGEDSVEINNDLADLTPYLREDTLLRLPQHPLCRMDCAGLSNPHGSPQPEKDLTAQEEPGAAAWNELDKLKLD